IEGSVDDEALRITLGDLGIAFDGVAAVPVEILEIGRLDDGHVVGPVDEQVVIEIVGAVLLELALLPKLILRAEIGMIGVKTLHELLAMNVALVLRTAVPEMG